MKWFTYCGHLATGHTIKTYRGGQRERVTHAKDRHDSRAEGDLGLLFHSTDENDPITAAELLAAAKDPVVEELFPNGCYVQPAEDGDWILTDSSKYAVLPDQASLHSPSMLMLNNEGEVHEVNLRDRFDNCLELIKILGCANCPKRGAVCLREASTALAQREEPLFTAAHSDEDTAKELLLSRKTKVGNFTYISPMLTIPEGDIFVRGLRHPNDHDFGMIDANSESRGEASKLAAERRAFRKKQCGKCPVRAGGCHADFDCAGAYPPDAEISQRVLARWEPLIAEGPFTPWQFWAIARSGNRPSTYKVDRYRRYSVRLHGLTHTYRNGWSAIISRDKCEPGKLKVTSDYTLLQQLFDLPETEERAAIWAKRPEGPEGDMAAALYLHLTEYERSSRQRRSGGWGGGAPWGILSKTLYADHVSIVWHGPSYSGWSQTISKWSDVFQHISHEIPAPQEIYRIGGHRWRQRY
jgi:hypothetical protein